MDALITSLIALGIFALCMFFVILIDIRNAGVKRFSDFNWKQYWYTNQIRLLTVAVVMVVVLFALWLMKQWIDGIVQQLIMAITGLGTTVASKEISKEKRITGRPTPLDIARRELGTAEIAGGKANPKIVRYFARIGFTDITSDETHWCTAFGGFCLAEAGYKFIKTLRAKGYLVYGEKGTWDDLPTGRLIAILHRGDPSSPTGHFTFPTSKPVNGKFYGIGGNQSNMVTEAPFKEEDIAELRLAV